MSCSSWTNSISTPGTSRANLARCSEMICFGGSRPLTHRFQADDEVARILFRREQPEFCSGPPCEAVHFRNGFEDGLDAFQHRVGLGERSARRCHVVDDEPAFVHLREEAGFQPEKKQRAERGDRNRAGDDKPRPPQRVRHPGPISVSEPAAALVMCSLRSQEERGRNRDEQQRIHEREEHRRRQRQRQRREELPDDALQQRQRDEDDHCRQRRSDDRAHQFVRAALRGHQRGGAAAQMAMDVLHDDDGVVDDKSNGNRQAAHRHQVDRPARELQDAEGAEDRERQGNRRDECRPPVAEEEEQHEHCKRAAQDDRVTHAADRVAHERREIVDLRNAHSRRKRAGLLLQRLFHLVGDVDRGFRQSAARC